MDHSLTIHHSIRHSLLTPPPPRPTLRLSSAGCCTPPVPVQTFHIGVGLLLGKAVPSATAAARRASLEGHVMKSLWIRPFLSLIFLAVFGTVAFAQTFTGGLRGAVRDEGGVIP